MVSLFPPLFSPFGSSPRWSTGCGAGGIRNARAGEGGGGGNDAMGCPKHRKAQGTDPPFVNSWEHIVPPPSGRIKILAQQGSWAPGAFLSEVSASTLVESRYVQKICDIEKVVAWVTHAWIIRDLRVLDSLAAETVPKGSQRSGI